MGKHTEATFKDGKIIEAGVGPEEKAALMDPGEALATTGTRVINRPIDQPAQRNSSPGALLMMAMERGLPTEQLQLFIEGHQKALEDDRRGAYLEAMGKAQGEYLPVRKSARSDRGKYAPMDVGVEAVRAANSKFGLFFRHIVKSEVIPGSDPPAALVRVQCVTAHEDGHEEYGEPMETVATEIPGTKPGNPQMSLIRAIKGASTFLRRVTFEAAHGIAPTDDDDMAGQPPASPRPAPGRSEPRRQQAPTSAQRPQEPAQPTDALEPWVTSYLARLKTVGVLRADLEGNAGRGLGVPATEWSQDAHKAELDAIGKAVKAVAPAQRPALVRELFDLEPGAEG